MKSKLKQWEQMTNDLVESWIAKHFGNTAYWYWVGDNIGGCISVEDYFFDIDDIVDFERYHYTSDEVFGYYNARLEEAMKNKTLL